MDLKKLSDADLKAVAEGRIADVSDAGLKVLAGEEPAPPAEAAQTNASPNNTSTNANKIGGRKSYRKTRKANRKDRKRRSSRKRKD